MLSEVVEKKPQYMQRVLQKGVWMYIPAIKSEFDGLLRAFAYAKIRILFYNIEENVEQHIFFIF